MIVSIDTGVKEKFDEAGYYEIFKELLKVLL
jgi:hypothetical protein